MRYTIFRSGDVTEEIFLKECKAEFPKLIKRNPFSVNALRLIYSYLKNEEAQKGKEIWLNPQSVISRFREDYFEQYFNYHRMPIDECANAVDRLVRRQKMKQVITQQLQGRLVGFVLETASASGTLERVVYSLDYGLDLDEDLELEE